jgi:hypothetical protein
MSGHWLDLDPAALRSLMAKGDDSTEAELAAELPDIDGKVVTERKCACYGCTAQEENR